MTTTTLFDRIVAKCTDVEVGDFTVTFHCDCGMVTVWRIGDSLYTDALDIPAFFWVKMCQSFWLAVWQKPLHASEVLSLEALMRAFQNPDIGNLPDPHVYAREVDRRERLAQLLWEASRNPAWV